jgi:NAD(P)-dependent dehydrogenase (short-subunit alcohol dehydrogenase family)
MAGRLDGKVAIITGGGSGLGEASALRFAEEGAAVVCADIDLAAAARVVGRIEANGGRGLAIRVDVTSPEDNDAMAAAALDAYGRIDALYANAGIAAVGALGTTSQELWDRAIAIMLTGVWLSDKAVLPAMEAQGGGSIINQASVGGLVGVNGISPYAAAKAGVIGLTRQAAVEYGPKNIRFNAVCPGTVVTPLVTKTYEDRARSGSSGGMTQDEAFAAMTAKYPIGRLGDPVDIANMALFLASDEANWITGAVFPVDGGYTAA